MCSKSEFFMIHFKLLATLSVLWFRLGESTIFSAIIARFNPKQSRKKKHLEWNSYQQLNSVLYSKFVKPSPHFVNTLRGHNACARKRALIVGAQGVLANQSVCGVLWSSDTCRTWWNFYSWLRSFSNMQRLCGGIVLALLIALAAAQGNISLTWFFWI